MEDISSNNKWTRADKLQLGDTVVSREVGESTNGLMREWVKLRSSYGVEGRRQFETLRIWGQPAAWADSIVHCWVSDLLHSLVPQSINVLDCFTGQWSPVVLETCWNNQQFQIPVGPDTTPLLQIADVAVISQAKAAGERRKSELLILLAESAIREECQFSGKMGKYEVSVRG